MDIDLEAARQRTAGELDGQRDVGQPRCTATSETRRWFAEALDQSVQAGGPVDVLLANAGGALGLRAPFLEIEPADWVALIDLNLNGPFYCGQTFAKHMVEQGKGSIVFTASQIGMVAFPNLAHYCSAKAGVIHLVRCMAAELAPYGVRVNAIAPGGVLTERLRKSRSRDPAALDDLAGRVPLQRLAEPDEVVGAAMYLASDDGSYSTGTTIVVDGGYIAI